MAGFLRWGGEQRSTAFAPRHCRLSPFTFASVRSEPRPRLWSGQVWLAGGQGLGPPADTFWVVLDATCQERENSPVAHHGVGVRSPYCGKSLQSLITIMTVEPTATATGQINGNSSTRPTMVARTRRVLFDCAKRKPATPIGHLRLAPSKQRAETKREKWGRTIASSGVPYIEVKEPFRS